ncbi:MAG: histone deacetylase [Spirochaetia bacterium]|nr:histone deacetylase [Spirochaetia bacterium]
MNIEAKNASEEDICKVHSIAHYNKIKSLSEKKGYLDGDTPYSPKTTDAALKGAGAGFELVDRIINRELENGMVLVRPPGHHAERDHAMGFCIFNNIAITAKYIQKKGFKKIAIIDWDVHHGNGTENTFYDDDSVLFISTHQYPFYPGSGSESDTGTGKGRGYNINIPMQRGSGISEFIKAFDNKIIPSLENFIPDFILISAGFDAHINDPLANLELTTKSYEIFTEKLMSIAKQYCENRIISFLEGGYDLKALSESVEAHISVLAG